MKKILVTGGTAFVSKYTAHYFLKRGYSVFVLNRNRGTQIEGVHLIQADRHHLNGILRKSSFDAILDITAYTREDVEKILDSGIEFEKYILISSSAVYPEYERQPFVEETGLGRNRFWGKYGTDKIGAEAALREIPGAYIIRPPYLYGEMNNLYREAFVFECALEKRSFFVPGTGELRLQFFHIDDLCRFMEIILNKRPKQRIFNVGNVETISTKEWVKYCYRAVGERPEIIEVHEEIEQRSYFPFYDYEYRMDISKQLNVMPDTLPLRTGLQRSFEWFVKNKEKVNRKPFLEFIDRHWKL